MYILSHFASREARAPGRGSAAPGCALRYVRPRGRIDAGRATSVVCVVRCGRYIIYHIIDLVCTAVLKVRYCIHTGHAAASAAAQGSTLNTRATQRSAPSAPTAHRPRRATAHTRGEDAHGASHSSHTFTHARRRAGRGPRAPAAARPRAPARPRPRGSHNARGLPAVGGSERPVVAKKRPNERAGAAKNAAVWCVPPALASAGVPLRAFILNI